jgi:RNA recognition motif-containing protein
MAKNIYVGNLIWGINSDDLLALFQSYGAVSQAQVISDRETGRSRGFGFVVMQNDEEAQQAIEGLNGQDFRGRPLTVNEARPREESRGVGGGRGTYGGGGYGGSRGGHGGRGGYSARGRDY